MQILAAKLCMCWRTLKMFDDKRHNEYLVRLMPLPRKISFSLPVCSLLVKLFNKNVDCTPETYCYFSGLKNIGKDVRIEDEILP